MVEAGYSNTRNFYKINKENWIYYPYATYKFSKNLRTHLHETNPYLRKFSHDPHTVFIQGKDACKLDLYENKWYSFHYDNWEYESYYYGNYFCFFWDDIEIHKEEIYRCIDFFEEVNADQTLVHVIQNNQIEYYKKYKNALGRYTPNNKFVASGQTKIYEDIFRGYQYQSKMEEYFKKHDHEVYKIYNEGIERIRNSIKEQEYYDYFLKSYRLGHGVMSKKIFIKEASNNDK
jgi:hypothetical protein